MSADKAEQLTFTGQAEPVNPGPEDYPPDVMEALGIVTGNVPDTLGDNPQGTPEQISPSEQQDIIKAGMLKKTDRIEKFQRLENVAVEVLDISSDTEAKRLAEILALIGDPRNQMMGQETPPQTLLDPSAPRGFRTIVVLKFWKVVADAKILAPNRILPSDNVQPVQFHAPQNANSVESPAPCSETKPG